VTVGNGTISNFAGSGKAYTFDVTPTAYGTVTVDVAANVAINGACSGNAAAAQLSIEYVCVAPSVSITTDALVSCNCGNDGAITASVSGGEAPYTYEWAGSETTAGLTNLAPGTYSVTVTDANGCTGTASVDLEYAACASAVLGNALNFDGTDDFVNLGQSVPYTSTFTYEAWVRAESFKSQVWQGSIITWEFGGNSGIMLRAGGNGVVEAVARYGSAWYLASSPSNTLQLNHWHHVALVYDGTALILYVDGAQIALRNMPTPNTPAGDLRIGNAHFDNARFWDGDIDEVRIWSVARTGLEIASNKDAELTGNEAGLAAYYQFNQGVAGGTNAGINTLLDATSNGRNGSMQLFELSGASSNWVVGASTDAPGVPNYSEIGFSAGTTDFGNATLGAAETLTYTINNTGVGPLVVAAISSSDANFTVTPRSANIAPGGSANFDVVFVPTAIGADNATITIVSNDCDEGAITFDVTGTGSLAARQAYISTASSEVVGPFEIDILFWEGVSGLLPNELVITNATYTGATIVSDSHYRLTLNPVNGGNVTVSLPADQAQSVVDGTGNDASNMLTVAYNGLNATCVPAAANAANDWIQRVRLFNGTTSYLDNISGKNGGYANFDALGAVSMAKGSSYELAIHAGGTAGRPRAYRIWIDYNRDGDMFDAGEMAYTQNVNTLSIVRGVIAVPGTAKTGLARMRVRMKYAQMPYTSCENFPYGETEDYLVNLVPSSPFARTGQGTAAALEDEAFSTTLSVYPNPAVGQVQVRFAEGGAVALVSLDGRVLQEATASNGQATFDVSDLPTGLYLVVGTDASGLRQTVKLAVE
jgi:hypothetical protein